MDGWTLLNDELISGNFTKAIISINQYNQYDRW